MKVGKQDIAIDIRYSLSYFYNQNGATVIQSIATFTLFEEGNGDEKEIDLGDGHFSFIFFHNRLFES